MCLDIHKAGPLSSMNLCKIKFRVLMLIHKSTFLPGGPLDLMSRRVVAAGSREIADYIVQQLKPINYGCDDDDP